MCLSGTLATLSIQSILPQGQGHAPGLLRANKRALCVRLTQAHVEKE